MIKNIFSACQRIGVLRTTHRLVPAKPPAIGHTRAFSRFSQDWPDRFKTILDNEGICKATDIQERTLSIALERKDLVGVARTGSGKTLAFLIPGILKILKLREEGQCPRPSILVLAPTRELAEQTSQVISKFRSIGIHSIILVGGNSRSRQVEQLDNREFDAYVATPGRLIDLVESEIVNLSNIQYVVLDEADRMLDMGFEPQIRKIFDQLSENRQTLMYSATWPRDIQALANTYLKNFEYVEVDSPELSANPNIEQIIKLCGTGQKKLLLIDELTKIFKENPRSKILVFMNTKISADMLQRDLIRNRFRASVMHGNLTQNQRTRSLDNFRSGGCNILIASDVAARGLDIGDITHVINFELPDDISNYVHRIGRTARHEKKGIAINLISDRDYDRIPDLISILRKGNIEVPQELLEIQETHTPQPKVQRRGFGRPRQDFSPRYRGEFMRHAR